MSGKKLKRKLTPFLAQEMLYDYAIGTLDEERRAAVSEFVATNKESQLTLKQIQDALNYADALAKTELRDDLIVHLKEAESAMSLGRKYSSWRAWPETFRWSITALAVSFAIAGGVMLVPWKMLRPSRPSNSIEVAKIPVEATTSEGEADPQAENEAPTEEFEGSGDDVIDHDHAHAVPPTASATPLVKLTATPPPSALQSPKPSPTAQAAAPVAAPVADEDDSRSEAKPKGYVFRAFMTLNDLDRVGPQIAEDVRGFGGEKAGEVELGWNRGTGRYYHFTLPEENERKLVERLQVYGPVRISRDPHPRVMPRGQVRFILWVESAPQ